MKKVTSGLTCRTHDTQIPLDPIGQMVEKGAVGSHKLDVEGSVKGLSGDFYDIQGSAKGSSRDFNDELQASRMSNCRFQLVRGTWSMFSFSCSMFWERLCSENIYVLKT
jgi:hypothetical protein